MVIAVHCATKKEEKQIQIQKKNKIKTKRENRFHDDAIECR